MALSQGSLFVLQFGSSVVLARLLTPYEMGVYAVAYAITSMLGLIRAFGLNTFLIRETHPTPRVVRTVFTINALLAIATSAAIMALSRAGGAWLGEVGVQHVLVLLGLLPLIGLFDFLPATFLERHGAFRVIALINLSKTTVSTLVTIALARDAFSYMSFAWGTLAGALVGAVCLNIVGWHHVTLQPCLQDWRRVTRFGMQILMVAAVGRSVGRLSDLLLGRLVGIGELGLYSRASGLNNLLWDNLHMVIGRIVFVEFAERWRNDSPIREVYLRIVSMITALLWPAFAGLAIFAGPVVLTVYGANWTSAALPLSMLSLSGLIMTSVTMAGEIYLVSGETRQFLHYEVKRSMFGLTLFLIGCLGGLSWAAASRIGEAIGIVYFCRTDLLRITRTEVGDYPPIYRQSLILTVVACAPALLLMFANDWSARTPLLPIAAVVGLGIAAWGLCLWLMRHPLFDEARIIGRRLFRPAVQDA